MSIDQLEAELDQLKEMLREESRRDIVGTEVIKLRKKLTEAQTFHRACEAAFITPNMARMRNRTLEIAFKRQIVFYLLRHHGMTFKKIGAITERDHGSILHGVRNVTNLIGVDPARKSQVEHAAERFKTTP